MHTGFANGDSNLKILLHITVGGRSSMVEPQIVVLVVAGSSPVGHPLCQSVNSEQLLAATIHESLITIHVRNSACSSTG
jgi:hypothetical protein